MIKKQIDQLYTYLARLAASPWAPVVIAGLAILTRVLGVVLTHGRPDLGDDSDQVYFRVAQHYFATGHMSFFHPDWGEFHSWLPPGMAFLYMGYMSLFGSDMSYFRFFFIAMSVVANVTLFYVGKRLFREPTALLAALLWALYPPQWFWASRANPNTYATNMVIFCLWLLFVSWEKRSYWRAFLVGALWTTAALNRGEYVLGIVVLSVASLFAFPKKSTGILFACLLVAGWGLALAPWVARNYRVHHSFVLIGTNDGDNFWKAYNPNYNFSGYDVQFPPELNQRIQACESEVQRSHLLKAEAFNFIRTHPGRAMRNVLGNLINFWRPWLSLKAVSMKELVVYLASYLPVFIFFIWGLFLMPKKNPYWMAVGGLILYKWLIHSFFYVIVRFREAILPLILLVAALPFEKIQFGSVKDEK